MAIFVHMIYLYIKYIYIYIYVHTQDVSGTLPIPPNNFLFSDDTYLSHTHVSRGEWQCYVFHRKKNFAHPTDFIVSVLS
jgi:hypothetical protein